ncbi:MAG: SLC13 family permease [Prevotella sp.]|nr:SLC13 family permease [Prevotella sp.]
MKKGETLLVTYKTETDSKAFVGTSKNFTVKGGEKGEETKTIQGTVSKDGDVALTSKGGALYLQSITLTSGDKTDRKWDFTTLSVNDKKNLSSDKNWTSKNAQFKNADRISGADYGTVLSSTDIMATFANPVIMLFLGGFILAIAATKSGLDVLLARNLIRPFGQKSENVLLGFLLITGIFSMFVSNTATAAMMLTFLTPVFAALPANGKGRIALTLCIPVAANIGGMATPIGTPPNAIALQALNEQLHMNISFGQWMMIMFPLTIVILLLSWFIILKMFPFTQKTIKLDIKGHVAKGWRMWVVSITFIITILMWLLDRVTGVDANTVALIPMGVFAITGVITGKDLQSIDWSVIWMVAGGFALGLGLNGSGLAAAAIDSIPFANWSPIVILLVSGLICYLLSNFISNTATAALLVPILAVVCTGMGDRLDAIGGTATIIMGIALSASAAMCLPISTPPNAIAYSTGLVKQDQMLKIGLTVGLLTLLLGYIVLYIFGKMHVIG